MKGARWVDFPEGLRQEARVFPTDFQINASCFAANARNCGLFKPDRMGAKVLHRVTC